MGKLPGQEKANRHWIGALHAAARTGCISHTCGFPRVLFGAIQAILLPPPSYKNRLEEKQREFSLLASSSSSSPVSKFRHVTAAGGMYSILFRRMLLRDLVISRKLVCANLAFHVVTHRGTDVLGDKCEPGNFTISQEWMGMHGGYEQASDSAGDTVLHCIVCTYSTRLAATDPKCKIDITPTRIYPREASSFHYRLLHDGISSDRGFDRVLRIVPMAAAYDHLWPLMTSQSSPIPHPSLSSASIRCAPEKSP